MMTRKPAPGTTTQSNGLLFGEPEGNEHTFTRLTFSMPRLPGRLDSFSLHSAWVSCPSSPAAKCSSTRETVHVLVPSRFLTEIGDEHRSFALSLQEYRMG